jgi:hypothetical protein
MAQADSNNITTAPAVSTRRHFLSRAAGIAAGGTALAAAVNVTALATAGPMLAVSAPVDTDAERLWATRLQHCDRLRAVIPVWEAALERRPVWAKPGQRCIDREGNPCGGEVGWTIDPTVYTTVPYASWGLRRVIRPSPYDIRLEHEVCLQDFVHSEGQRAKILANMDRRLAALEAREQERARLRDELGITEFSRQIEEAADGVSDCEWELEDLDRTPDVAAAMVMAELGTECLQDATIAGDNRSGTMRIAAAALEALLPNLSGLIREHAAFFIANRTTPLSAMPFHAP